MADGQRNSRLTPQSAPKGGTPRAVARIAAEVGVNMQGLEAVGIRKLLSFHEIANSKSFREAARKLGISQPALTRQVHSLEEDLAVVLIHRHASGNTLTEAGRILAKKAEELLAVITSAKSELDELKGDPTGIVTIGLSTGFAGSFLSAFLSGFAERFPRVQLRLMEGSTRHVEDWLHSGQAEIGIICLPFGSTQLVEETLVREELFLISQTQRKRAESISFAGLAALDLVLPLPKYGTRQLLDRMAADHSVTFRPKMEADNPNTIKQLVMSTGWAAVHSALLFEDELAAGSVTARSIRPPPMRSIALVTPHDRPLSTASRAIATAIGDAVRDRFAASRVEQAAFLKLAG
jgi:LysR family transcriptional regulator, nitrogen assimilation regulatory protein